MVYSACGLLVKGSKKDIGFMQYLDLSDLLTGGATYFNQGVLNPGFLLPKFSNFLCPVLFKPTRFLKDVIIGV